MDEKQTSPISNFTNDEEIKYKKHTSLAYPPKLNSEYACGYDLYTPIDVVVPAYGKVLISTDISIELPRENLYARIAPKSSLAWKNHIDVGGGIIDNDYRGIIKVILYNHSDIDVKIQAGNPIAQMIIEKYYKYKLREVEKLSETKRGEGGFGSTHKNT
jgi:dUTP pyrophosphatase